MNIRAIQYDRITRRCTRLQFRYAPLPLLMLGVRRNMTKREAIHKELSALYKSGAELAVAFQKKEKQQFHYDYQSWYTPLFPKFKSPI